MPSNAARLTLVVISGLLCACGNNGNQDDSSVAAIDALVVSLRVFPPTLGPQARSDGRPIPTEQARSGIYAELYAHGELGVLALGRGLRHDDVRVRRNAALALFAFGIGYTTWGGRRLPPADISPALADLEVALTDEDFRIRASAANTVFFVGEEAVTAVPELIEMLASEDEGTKEDEGMKMVACFALRGIGPAAESALPALRLLLSDSSERVRDQARMAIDSIEGR